MATSKNDNKKRPTIVQPKRDLRISAHKVGSDPVPDKRAPAKKARPAVVATKKKVVPKPDPVLTRAKKAGPAKRVIVLKQQPTNAVGSKAIALKAAKASKRPVRKV